MRAHCARCEVQVEAAYENPGLQRWAKLYFVIPLPFLPLFPIIAADFTVMLPLVMLYLIGVGPVLSLVRAPPLCTECGALIPDGKQGVPQAG